MLTGTHLSATPTALLFDYDPAPADITTYVFEIFGAVGELNGTLAYTTGFFSFLVNICDASTTCFVGLGENRSGVGVIAGTVDSATPLPATLPLFTTGLGALSLLGWRRKKKSAAFAA